jgi:uncharacterized phage-associated protein
MPKTDLNPRLAAVLARLCERLGPLFKTQAVKLPYLVDVVANHVLGHTIANGGYQAWEHGVVAREVYRFIGSEAEGSDLFTVQPHAYSEGGKKIALAKPPWLDPLSPDEIAVVDAVADLYGSMPPETLGHLTKQMNTEIAPAEWGSNHPASLGEDAFLRLSPDWQRLCARINSENLDDRTRWGAPINDDPMGHLLRALNA